MRTSSSKVAILFIASNFINLGLSIITIKFYAGEMSPKEYGALGQLLAFSDIISVLAGFGLTAPCYLMFFDYERNNTLNKYKLVINYNCLNVVFTFLLSFGIFSLYFYFFGNFFNLENEQVTLILLLGHLTALFNYFGLLSRAVAYKFLSAFLPIILKLLTLAIYSSHLFNDTLLFERISAQIIACLIIVGITYKLFANIFQLDSHKLCQITISEKKWLYTYSLGSMPGLLCAYLIPFICRTTAQNNFSTELGGVFFLATQLCSIPDQFSTGIQKAESPNWIRRLVEKDAIHSVKYVVKSMSLYSSFLMVPFTALYFSFNFIIAILDLQKYSNLEQFIGIVLLAHYCKGIFTLFMVSLVAWKFAKLRSLIRLISFLIFLVVLKFKLGIGIIGLCWAYFSYWFSLSFLTILSFCMIRYFWLPRQTVNFD